MSIFIHILLNCNLFGVCKYQLWCNSAKCPPKKFPLRTLSSFPILEIPGGGEYMVIFKFVSGHTCIGLKQQLSESVSVCVCGGGVTLCMGGHLHSYNSFGDIKQYIYYASSLPHCLS